MDTSDGYFARHSHTCEDEGPSLSRPVYITDGSAQRTVAESNCLPFFLRRDTWRLEDFDLTSELYRGKSSAVFLALDKQSGTEVVLKMYRKRKLSALNRQQVEREIRIHTHLQHPNVIQLYAAFEDKKVVCLVLEPAHSGDLFERLRTGGQLSEEQAVEVVVGPLLHALTHLHSNSIIHRDIKPENILVSSGDVVRLADFGMAIDTSHERPVTRVGTLDYLAPEVLSCPDKASPEDNKDNKTLAYDTRVDVWAMGILAYELLVGYPPFEHESRTETYNNIMFTDPVYPPTMSAEATSFIRCSLSKDPLSRPLVLDLVHHPWIQQYSCNELDMPASRAYSAPNLNLNLLGLDMHLASSTGPNLTTAGLMPYGPAGTSRPAARASHLSYTADPPSPSTAAADILGQLSIRANSWVSTPQQAASLTSRKRSFCHGNADVSLSRALANSLSARFYPGVPVPASAEPRESVDEFSVAASGLSSSSFSSHVPTRHSTPSRAAAPGQPSPSEFELAAACPAMLRALTLGAAQQQQDTAGDLALPVRQYGQLRLMRPIKPTHSPRTGSPAPVHPQQRPVSSLASLPQSRLGRSGAASWSGAARGPGTSSLHSMPWSLSQVPLSGAAIPTKPSVTGPDTPQACDYQDWPRPTAVAQDYQDGPRLNYNMASLSLQEDALDLTTGHDFTPALSTAAPQLQQSAGEPMMSLFAKRLRSGAAGGAICTGSLDGPPADFDDQLSGLEGQTTPQAGEAPPPCPWSPGLRRLYSAPR